jgi:D-galactarolactone cycloisomerase
MKITEVKVYHLQKHLSSTMQISRGGFQVRNHIIVQVITNAGIYGLGEGVGNANYIKALLEGPIGAMAIGLDPLNIDEIREKLIDDQVYFERMGSAICAASAIEMACWDIMGKYNKLPVYELLGGLKQKKLEAYASDVYWEKDPNKMLERVFAIKELGLKTVKAHIGYKDPNEDLARVEAIRRGLGEDHNMIIDLNCGYDYRQTLEAIDLWQSANLTWLEEPVNPNLYIEMRKIKEQSAIPIAAGENEFLVHGFRTLFENNAVDIAMPDIGRAGGILETQKICELAQSYNVDVSPHNYSSGVLLAATMHLMAATPNTKLLEYDASVNAVYHEFFSEPLEFIDGHIKVQDTPGFGVELKTEILEKYAI